MSQETALKGGQPLVGLTAKLDEIIDHGSLSPEEKIQAILREGNAYFGTAFALVSEIQGETYRVVHSQSDIAPAEPGSEFALGQTYCLQTIRANGPVAYHCAGASELSDHPCYSVFQLDTYIGAPVTANGRIVGTVNFTDIETRAPFSADDLETIAAIAARIEALLAA